jgi:hypothetical protein
MENEMEIRSQRKELLTSIGLNVEDVNAWVVKWQALKDNSKLRGSTCTLTFEQYIHLAISAGLKSPDQIGKRINSYQMARFGDVGVYEYGNCRFITMKQNLEEKRLNGGVESQASAIRGRTKYTDSGFAAVSDKRSKYFRLVSPDGMIFEGKNLREFCITNGLNPGNMSAVCTGKAKQCKGWTGSYIL